MFELKNNQELAKFDDMSVQVVTCLQMSCHFNPLADTTFSCVGDMTKTCRRHDTPCLQMKAREWGRHDTKRHSLLSPSGLGTIRKYIINWCVAVIVLNTFVCGLSRKRNSVHEPNYIVDKRSTVPEQQTQPSFDYWKI